MVEEALVATLSGQVHPTDGDVALWEEQLRYLFDYAQACDDASEWFDDKETEAIVRGHFRVENPRPRCRVRCLSHGRTPQTHPRPQSA